MSDLEWEEGDGTLCVSVPENLSGERLDKALAGLCEDLSRTRLRQLIEKGQVKLNKAGCINPKHKVTEGDLIEVVVPPPVDDSPKPENIPLDIIYEDNDLLVINKPAGLTVHPGAGQADGTLVNALLYHCADSLSGIGGVKRPGIVHRLDKETTGLMVVAKNDRAHAGLSEQLADRTLGRIYDALVWRVPVPLKGKVDQSIGRHRTHRLKMTVGGQGTRSAVTHYHMQEPFGEAAAWVECILESGRTHQIRVHMAHIKHPVIGDPLYGLAAQAGRSLLNRAGYEEEAKEEILAFPRQALHAREIHFIHPVSDEEMSFEAPWPADFQALYDRLKTV